jgi:hypothetical protein
MMLLLTMMMMCSVKWMIWHSNVNISRTEINWTPWSRVQIYMIILAQLVNKSPAFYRIRNFIKARYWFVSWIWLNQSTPLRPIPLSSILTSTSKSSTQMTCSLHVFRIKFCNYSHLAHFNLLPWFDNPNNIWRRLQFIKLHIMHFAPSTCYVLSLRPCLQVPSIYVLPLW